MEKRSSASIPKRPAFFLAMTSSFSARLALREVLEDVVEGEAVRGGAREELLADLVEDPPALDSSRSTRLLPMNVPDPMCVSTRPVSSSSV